MKNSKSTTPSTEASQMDNYDEENTNTSTSTNCFDLSLLRKPIVTSITGFQEAKKAYDNGTEEIKKLLANECDLIYECKVCRNIFRSLVNFISHKRVYCQTTFNTSHHFHFNNNGFIDQDISTIIQAEQEFINNHRTAKSSNGSTKSRTEPDFNKDLSSIVERLMKKQRTKNELKLSDFYEQIGNKFVTQNSDATNGSTSSDNNIVLQLNTVPDSSAAVYQTVKIHEKDNIKDEIDEVHEMLENNNILLGPDGKAVSVSPVDMAIAGTSKLPEHACEICDERFSTEKTLKIHIEKKHIPSTTVFPCPTCPETFLQPGAVLKHLSNVHQKSQKRIRQMRDNICKRGTRLDEVKPQIREAASSKLPEKVDDLTAWNRDFPNNTPSCPYCNKSFDRKAVLVSHVQNCGVKESKSSSRKRTATPKITATVIKIEPEFGDENSSTSCDTSTSKTLEIKTPEPDKLLESLTLSEKSTKINKRKRKGPLVIRNESPEIKDEADMYWGAADGSITPVSKDNLLIDESKIKTENETTDHEMVIEEPPKKRKLKKESEEGDVVKNIPCALCSKKFATNTNLKRHVAMFHFRQNRFACKLCEFRGYRRVDTITHLGNAHNIHGEKEEVNKHIEISIKEDDLRGPINTNEKCDPNLTFSSVVASILNASPNTSSVNKNSTNLKNTKKRIKIEPSESGKLTKEESGGSGGSTPNSEKNLDLTDTKRPTRNRVKPVRKDFVYDLNKIIKQEAEVHREQQQQQQQQLLPIRNQRRRNTTAVSTEVVVVKEAPKTEIELNKENVIVEKTEGYQINEISGAALKMAKIEVMNQRACFHKPPEIPCERPNFIPAKVSSAPRKSGKIIKDVSAMIKEPSKRGRKREVKRTPSFTDTFLSTTSSKEFKRTPSFTDTFLKNNSSVDKFRIKASDKKPKINNESFSVQTVDTSTPIQSTKATKKQELSSKEKTQLEMLQRFRDEQNSSGKTSSTLTQSKSDISGVGKRISVLQRLAENKRKSQEFLRKPNYDKNDSM